MRARDYNPDKISKQFDKNGNLIIHFRKLYDDSVYVWTKIIKIGDIFRLSDGGAFLKSEGFFEKKL